MYTVHHAALMNYHLFDHPCVQRSLAGEAMVLADYQHLGLDAMGLELAPSPRSEGEFSGADGKSGRWVYLHMAGSCWNGEIHAAINESLPFADASFRVLIVRHVLEWLPEAHPLLQECERLLEPGGQMIIAGFQPYLLPGLCMRRQAQRYRQSVYLRWGWYAGRELAALGMSDIQSHYAGGGYVLSARKWHSGGQVIRLRFKPEMRNRAVPLIPNSNRIAS